MNIKTLIQGIRDAVHDYAALETWCISNYDRSHKVYILDDERSPSDEDSFPLVQVNPGRPTKIHGVDETEIMHEVEVHSNLLNDLSVETGKANAVEPVGFGDIVTMNDHVIAAVNTVTGVPYEISELTTTILRVGEVLFRAENSIVIRQHVLQGDDYLA